MKQIIKKQFSQIILTVKEDSATKFKFVFWYILRWARYILCAMWEQNCSPVNEKEFGNITKPVWGRMFALCDKGKYNTINFVTWKLTCDKIRRGKLKGYVVWLCEDVQGKILNLSELI